MAKQRTSTHRGKKGFAKHNEHRFFDNTRRGVKLYSYIHQKENTEWDLTFDEMKFYERYTEQLEEQNAKYRERRQYKRMKTLKDFYETKRYQPTEEILQYGHVGGEVPDVAIYEKMVQEYVSRKVAWAQSHGAHLHILDYANHYDESTPHTHLREVWDYTDDNGVLRVAQEEAMRLAGIELPDPSKKEGRYNNRNMTYTKMCREMWQDVCEEFGFEVERVPLENGRKKSETVPQYHARKGRELKEKEDSVKTLEDSLKDREGTLNALQSDITHKQKELSAKESVIADKETKLNTRERNINQKVHEIQDKLNEKKSKLNKRQSAIQNKEKELNDIKDSLKARERELEREEYELNYLKQNLKELINQVKDHLKKQDYERELNSIEVEQLEPVGLDNNQTELDDEYY